MQPRLTADGETRAKQEVQEAQNEMTVSSQPRFANRIFFRLKLFLRQTILLGGLLFRFRFPCRLVTRGFLLTHTTRET